MEEIVKKDIIALLKETLAALEKKEPDSYGLREISNHTIHNASVYQDEYSTSIAILVYSLSKIIERVKGDIDFFMIKNLLKSSVECLEKDNIESYQEFIKKIFDIISNSEHKYKLYIQEVMDQASIRKGSKIYEHGISASKTAEILGISLWDLYNYIGKTSIADSEISTVRERLKFTRSLFS